MRTKAITKIKCQKILVGCRDAIIDRKPIKYDIFISTSIAYSHLRNTEKGTR